MAANARFRRPDFFRFGSLNESFAGCAPTVGVRRLPLQSPSSMRYSYPADEKKYDWLPLLLDAYNILDRAASLGLKEERRKRGREVACRKGCYECCLRPSVPITKIELAGISWYASEKLAGGIRDIVKRQLLDHLQTSQCPFLVDTACSIYPVRPIACRQFHVFGDACAKGEDPGVTRPTDIWSPGREVAQKVAMKILPFFGISSEKQKIIAFKSGFIVRESKEMHKMDWNVVYQAMVLFDTQIGPMQTTAD